MEGMAGQSDGRIGDSGEMGGIAYYLYCESGPIDFLGGGLISSCSDILCILFKVVHF